MTDDWMSEQMKEEENLADNENGKLTNRMHLRGNAGGCNSWEWTTIRRSPGRNISFLYPANESKQIFLR